MLYGIPEEKFHCYSVDVAVVVSQKPPAPKFLSVPAYMITYNYTRGLIPRQDSDAFLPLINSIQKAE